jgi:hypothetical protein
MDLHGAVQKDSAEKVKELLATGKYQVNAKNANGVTPLHIAAFRYKILTHTHYHTITLSHYHTHRSLTIKLLNSVKRIKFLMLPVPKHNFI